MNEKQNSPADSCRLCGYCQRFERHLSRLQGESLAGAYGKKFHTKGGRT